MQEQGLWQAQELEKVAKEHQDTDHQELIAAGKLTRPMHLQRALLWIPKQCSLLLLRDEFNCGKKMIKLSCMYAYLAGLDDCLINKDVTNALKHTLQESCIEPGVGVLPAERCHWHCI